MAKITTLYRVDIIEKGTGALFATEVFEHIENALGAIFAKDTELFGDRVPTGFYDVRENPQLIKVNSETDVNGEKLDDDFEFLYAASNVIACVGRLLLKDYN